MHKSRRALSGGAKDMYLARAIAEQPGLDAATALSLARRLTEDIALVALKRPVRLSEPRSEPETEHQPGAVAMMAVVDSELAETSAAAVEFDPYSPNVIVVFRTHGREALLEALSAIDDTANLRLLAREQQLSLAVDLDDAAAIRAAIIEAAERRIANRRAAAS